MEPQMSRSPTLAESLALKKALAEAEIRARLVQKNKEMARLHLLQVQLVLARRPLGQ